MRIYYPTRSRFLNGCENAIRQNKKTLLTGTPISVMFSPQGYNGKIRVKIEKTNPTTFWADWESSDPTRFPVRIKAVAYALFRMGVYGDFVISHKTGILTIRYLGPLGDVSYANEKTKFYENKNDNHNTKSPSNTIISAYNLEKDVERCKAVAKILYTQFNNSDDGIFGHTDMPEEVLPENVKEGSYEHLMFITLTVSIDYQRDALDLWKASRQTTNDSDTRWIYSPKEVLKKSDNELINAMQKYKLSKKPIKDSLEIWKPVSKSFYALFESDPRKLLEECNYDALEVFELMKSRCKRYFPYLSGKKILPLWIRMMHDVVGIDLKNLEKIPIPVDVHVARATFCVGGLKGEYVGRIQDIFGKIDEVWKDACESLPYYRLQLDEPLWHLSKYGCTNRRENYCIKSINCPVSQYCISGRVYVSADKVQVNTRRGS